MTDPVVVTGLGVVGPGGRGPEALWDVVTRGRAGLVPVPFPGAPEGALAGMAPPVERREVVRTAVGRRIDRLSLMMLAAARDAVADAGLTDDTLRGPRTGIVIGSAFGNFGETAGFLDRLGTRGSGNPLVFPNLVMNASLSYVSIELGATGPTVMVTQQEVSGEAAIVSGVDLVESGVVDRCLVGAGDELTPELYGVLREVGALAVGRPCVLGKHAAGYVPGEGAVVLVLERESVARARRGAGLARIAHVVERSVDAPVHGWPRDPAEIAAAFAGSVARAALVVTSATGIPSQDRLEAAVLETIVPPGVPVVAPRGLIGHFGSAGIFGAAVAISTIRFRTMPPGPACAASNGRGFTVLSEARAGAPVPAVAVLGVARGGACCALGFEDPA